MNRPHPTDKKYRRKVVQRSRLFYLEDLESYCDYLERMLQVGNLSEDFGERTNSLVQSMINVNEKLQE